MFKVSFSIGRVETVRALFAAFEGRSTAEFMLRVCAGGDA